MQHLSPISLNCLPIRLSQLILIRSASSIKVSQPSVQGAAGLGGSLWSAVSSAAFGFVIVLCDNFGPLDSLDRDIKQTSTNANKHSSFQPSPGGISDWKGPIGTIYGFLISELTPPAVTNDTPPPPPSGSNENLHTKAACVYQLCKPPTPPCGKLPASYL
nr:uncharacterized protein LOC129154089 isoform X3 [Nothobranchius furzeri]